MEQSINTFCESFWISGKRKNPIGIQAENRLIYKEQMSGWIQISLQHAVPGYSESMST